MPIIEAMPLQILSDVSQFINPNYQRTHFCTQKICDKPLAEIVHARLEGEISASFIGSVEHIDKGLGNLALQALSKPVIKARQGLTTASSIRPLWASCSPQCGEIHASIARSLTWPYPV